LSKRQITGAIEQLSAVTFYCITQLAALPPQTRFTSIAMERQQIDVQGETDSTFRAVSYALALEESGRFSEVLITEIDEKLPADEETEQKAWK